MTIWNLESAFPVEGLRCQKCLPWSASSAGRFMNVRSACTHSTISEGPMSGKSLSRSRSITLLEDIWKSTLEAGVRERLSRSRFHSHLFKPRKAHLTADLSHQPLTSTGALRSGDLTARQMVGNGIFVLEVVESPSIICNQEKRVDPQSEAAQFEPDNTSAPMVSEKHWLHINGRRCPTRAVAPGILPHW